MACMKDGAPPKLNGLFDAHVVAILAVQHTVRKGGTRPDAKQLALDALSVIVHVVETGALPLKWVE